MASHKGMAWDVFGWHHGLPGGGSAHTDKMLGSMQPCVVVIGQRLLVPRSHGNPASACSQGAEAHGDPARSGGREDRACGMLVHMQGCMWLCMHVHVQAYDRMSVCEYEYMYAGVRDGD